MLPGVTVTALHEASGNTFVAVTDTVGAFRLPMRTGGYKVTVELPGFATIVRSVNLLLGQTAAVALEMSPSTVQESVTVTGEAPLIDTQTSGLAGNIDPKQMQELPLNGRNWMDLTLLAPGSGRTVKRRAAAPPGLFADQIAAAGHQQHIGMGDTSRASAATRSRNSKSSTGSTRRRTLGGMIANAITNRAPTLLGASRLFPDTS